MENKEITEKIIGCAYSVHNRMGYGYLESVYEKCMCIELREAGIQFETQKPITVSYKNEVVGEFIADLLIDNKIIAELKSVRTLSEAHEVQLVNYLVATGIPLGLLINFGEKNVEVKRSKIMKYLIILILLIGCTGKNTPKKEFKIGDCLVFQVKNDFYIKNYYDKIAAIGTNDYAFAGYQNVVSKRNTHMLYNKVDSKFCEGIK